MPAAITSAQALESMKDELRTLAKRANQRMVRLEGKKGDREENVSKLRQSNLSYSKTQTFLQNQSAKNSRISSERFVESKSTMDKMTEAEIQAQINRAKMFLQAKSSTKSGQKIIEKNRTIGLQDKIKSMEVEVDGEMIKLDENITYEKAKTIGDFFGELEDRGLYKKKGKSQLSSDEVIQKYYDIDESGYDVNPDEALKNVKTYEEAKKMNEIFNLKIFDLSQFEDDKGDDEDYEENI